MAGLGSIIIAIDSITINYVSRFLHKCNCKLKTQIPIIVIVIVIVIE